MRKSIRLNPYILELFKECLTEVELNKKFFIQFKQYLHDLKIEDETVYADYFEYEVFNSNTKVIKLQESDYQLIFKLKSFISQVLSNDEVSSNETLIFIINFVSPN